jgi:putative ABC transport system permease protein
VSLKPRELGLRIALGATPINLIRLIVSRGLRVTMVGIIIGVIASLSLTRLIGDPLYQVSARDPATFVAAFIVMLFATMAACFFPAFRATRIDPVRALKD